MFLSSPLACSTLPEDWGLQAQWGVVFDSQGLRDPLGDFGLEGWPNVTLESPGKSKASDIFIN
jgi:hypothetical protein